MCDCTVCNVFYYTVRSKESVKIRILLNWWTSERCFSFTDENTNALSELSIIQMIIFLSSCSIFRPQSRVFSRFLLLCLSWARSEIYRRSELLQKLSKFFSFPRGGQSEHLPALGQQTRNIRFLQTLRPDSHARQPSFPAKLICKKVCKSTEILICSEKNGKHQKFLGSRQKSWRKSAVTFHFLLWNSVLCNVKNCGPDIVSCIWTPSKDWKPRF